MRRVKPTSNAGVWDCADGWELISNGGEGICTLVDAGSYRRQSPLLLSTPKVSERLPTRFANADKGLDTTIDNRPDLRIIDAPLWFRDINRLYGSEECLCLDIGIPFTYLLNVAFHFAYRLPNHLIRLCW